MIMRMLQKIYGAPVRRTRRGAILRPRCIGCDMKVVSGDPDPKHVSTSYVERHNLTMRMSRRRFTRLTNAFLKEGSESLRHGRDPCRFYYNYGRIHKTLRVTPAMESGLTDHVWSLEEIVIDGGRLSAAKPAKRGPYKK